MPARLVGMTVHQRQVVRACVTSSVHVDPVWLLTWPSESSWQECLVLVRHVGLRAKAEILCVLIVSWKMLLEVNDSHIIR